MMEVSINFLSKNLSTDRYKNYPAGMESEGTERKQLLIANTDPGDTRKL